MERCERTTALGIDIGTTTISCTVIDTEEKRQLEAFTFRNGSDLVSERNEFKEQDPAVIRQKVFDFLETVCESYPNIRAIGFTGQMHGVLYVDADGNAVSPLYTWKDERAKLPTADGRTYCDEIKAVTGREISSGYGLATHYYNVKNGLVPEGAASLCTIMDYLAMQAAGRKEPLLHATNAASLGLYDPAEGDFDREAIRRLGMDTLRLPQVTGEVEAIGEYRGIPVFTALGDNQASVFGTLQNDDDILLNYGTGSQISRVVDTPERVGDMEVRPYLDGKYLLSGAALCGGRVYQLLRDFFAAYEAACGRPDAEPYEVMNRLAEEAYAAGRRLQVATTFCGTRLDPGKTGSITGIEEANFKPECLVLGVLQGMVDELYDMYRSSGNLPYRNVVASGNAVGKNPILQRLLTDKFQAELKLPAIREEAAFGAALAAAVAGGLGSRDELKQCIQYQGKE